MHLCVCVSHVCAHKCMSVGQSVQAAVKTIPDTGQLRNRRLLLTVLEAGRRGGSVSGEDPRPGSHCVLTQRRGWGAPWGLFH